jgi:hypothetical protein
MMARSEINEMRRTMPFKVLASIVITMTIAASILAQQSVDARASYKKNSGQAEHARLKAAARTYAPQIKGRSPSFVIEGRITSIGDNVITIKTARGARYDFGVDDQTSVFNSGELVSVATMADITLSASDLRISDRVEIVTERIGRQEVARIITRIASSDAQVAKR